MRVPLLDDAWQPVPMPHASTLLVQQLPGDTAGFTAFVRFTPGWRRERPASCTATEEFVILSGTLELNGIELPPGSLLHVPGGTLRSTTSTPEGCVAVAWFSGPPRWRTPDEPRPAGRPLAVTDLTLLADSARLTTGASRWVVHDGLPGGPNASACQLVDLVAPSWSAVAAGSADPVSPHRHLRRSPVARGGQRGDATAAATSAS